MVNFSAFNQGDRFFKNMIDYVNVRSKEIFGNNEKYGGLLFTNLPYITMEFKKDSLKIGVSQSDFNSNFSIDEQIFVMLIKDFHTFLVDVITKFEEPISFINGSYYISCSDISYCFSYSYNKDIKTLAIESEARNFRTKLSGEKVMTLVQIYPDTKQNDIASGVTVVQYGNKNNVGIKMDNHCPICHAVLPNGNTFCKNCDIDINDANKNQLKQYADDKKTKMEKIEAEAEAEAKAKRDAINTTLNIQNNKQELIQETKKKTNPFFDRINKMRGKS